MYYLPAEPYTDYQGNHLYKEDDVQGKPLRADPARDNSLKTPHSFPHILVVIADAYAPSQELMLADHGDMRKLNRAIEDLEGQPEDGYIAIEDERFSILKKVVKHNAARIALTSRSIPQIEDYMAHALAAKPETSLALQQAQQVLDEGNQEDCQDPPEGDNASDDA